MVGHDISTNNVNSANVFQKVKKDIFSKSN